MQPKRKIATKCDGNKIDPGTEQHRHFISGLTLKKSLLFDLEGPKATSGMRCFRDAQKRLKAPCAATYRDYRGLTLQSEDVLLNLCTRQPGI